MKISFHNIFTSLFFLTLGLSGAVGQVTGNLAIANQQVIGSDIYFDIYITRTGTNDIFLGSADFVLTFDNTNFTNPTFEKVENPNPYQGSVAYQNGYCNFTSISNSNPADPSTISEVQKNYFDATTTQIEGNQLIINLAFLNFSSQSEFESRVAKINNNSQTHRLGRFKVTGITNSSGTMNLQWNTTGEIPTEFYTHQTISPWAVEPVNYSTSTPENFPLPVEMISFEARKAGNDVELTWKTATEINNSGFTIQRSMNGQKWDSAGFVPGHGTSMEINEYFFTDFNATTFNSTKIYYRLMQEDFNGTRHPSAIRVISLNKIEGTNTSLVYPNPAGNSFRITGPEEMKIRRITATTTSGQIFNLPTNGKTVNCTLLPAGAYIVTIYGENTITRSRLIISR